MHARLCARPRGNGSRSLNRAANWCQVEISVAFPGASVARYLHHSSNQSVVDWVTMVYGIVSLMICVWTFTAWDLQRGQDGLSSPMACLGHFPVQKPSLYGGNALHVILIKVFALNSLYQGRTKGNSKVAYWEWCCIFREQGVHLIEGWFG